MPGSCSRPGRRRTPSRRRLHRPRWRSCRRRRHRSPRPRGPRSSRGCADLADPRLHHSLVVLGGVVLGVLAQVTVIARIRDPLLHDATAVGGQMLVFVAQLLLCGRGQPRLGSSGMRVSDGLSRGGRRLAGSRRTCGGQPCSFEQPLLTALSIFFCAMRRLPERRRHHRILLRRVPMPRASSARNGPLCCARCSSRSDDCA